MKAAISVTLSYSFLLNLIPLALSLQQSSGEAVRDFQGVPLSSGRQYTIAPSISGLLGGGVGLGIAVGNTKCPVTIRQDPSEIYHGIPVKFTVLGKTSGATILPGEPLEIEFVNKPACATSSKWVTVVDNKYPAGKWLGIGGAKDHPGKQIITGTFNIQKHELSYKLVFCPTTTTGPACSDIGRQNHNDFYGRVLILTNTFPFTVRFVNHNHNHTLTHG